MESEMIVGLIIFLSVPTLATAGAAALLFVWFGAMSRQSRVLAAAIGTPVLLFSPIFLLLVGDDDLSGGLEWLMVIALIGTPTIAIGWPVAHFMSRALERMRLSAVSVFD